MTNSNTFIFLFLCRDAINTNEGTGLYIRYVTGANAKLIVKGNNTFNSNGDYGGILLRQSPNTNLEIIVETGATLNSCGNGVYDIFGEVPAIYNATATFLGDGYTCNQTKVVFDGDGTVVEPTCQACP